MFTLATNGECFGRAASGASEYNSAQFTFERRYWKGLTVNVNYTFARNLTNITDGGATVTAGAGSILPYNGSYDWGNSDIGIKNRVSFRFNYELPFGRSGSRMTKLAIGGWQLNSLAFWQSGTPFAVVSQAFNPAQTNATLVTTDRPNTVSGQAYAATGQNYLNWINLHAFALQPKGSLLLDARWKPARCSSTAPGANQFPPTSGELQNTRRNATCICRGFPTMEVIVPTAPLPIFAFG